MLLDSVLLNLGTGIASNAIYDCITNIFRKNPYISKEQLEDIFVSELKIKGSVKTGSE